MSRKEEIINKSNELGQKYFSNANNIWARPNIEAECVSSACMEIAQWADKTMIDKACEWMECIDFEMEYQYSDDGFTFFNKEKFINDFCKAMEE